MSELLVRTFFIGIAVAAPVGAMGVLCIQRTLAHGWRAGMATGAGIATADATYAAAAAFGVSALSQALVSLQDPLRIVGGLVLVWLGWRAMVAPPAHDAAVAPDSARFGALYASAFALTLTNPMTIMAFGAIFASAGLGAEATLSAAAAVTAGVALGSFTWWFALVTGVALTRHAVSDRAIVWVNRASGAAVAIFGVLAIASVFLG